MADGRVSRQEVHRPSLARQPFWRRVRIRYRMTPWWLRVVVVWAVSRVVTTGILLWFAARQPENPWNGAPPD